MPSIEVRDLKVDRLKQPVLKGISTDITAGRITGLIGPSGCGKTTLMRTLVGTQKVTSGSATILGLPAGDRRLRSRVSYVTQSHAIYSDLTVRENLEYFAAVYRSGTRRIDETLELVGMHDHSHRVAAKLSGGQQSRVSLATALLPNPEILILDEPTVGLDPLLRVELWRVFRVLADESKTVVISSHVMDEAEKCDELLLMRDGEVLAQASPADLLRETGAASVEDAFLRRLR